MLTYIKVTNAHTSLYNVTSNNNNSIIARKLIKHTTSRIHFAVRTVRVYTKKNHDNQTKKIFCLVL